MSKQNLEKERRLRWEKFGAAAKVGNRLGQVRSVREERKNAAIGCHGNFELIGFAARRVLQRIPR